MAELLEGYRDFKAFLEEVTQEAQKNNVPRHSSKRKNKKEVNE